MSPNASSGAVLRGLLDDAAMFPPGNAPAEQAVVQHRRHRAAWYASVVGPLVVPDTALGQLSRAAADDPVDVSVVVSGGAGGISALVGRDLPGLRVVAVESALRDLDDLVGNAGRVVAAAAELDPAITVYVELPYAPGWVGAVEEVEAAGLYGKLRFRALESDPAAADEIVEQLSVLVEADLAFRVAAGPGPPLLALLRALDALIDGAGTAEAAKLLLDRDGDRSAAALRAFDDGSYQRLHRRLRGYGCLDLAGVVALLEAAELLDRPA